MWHPEERKDLGDADTPRFLCDRLGRGAELGVFRSGKQSRGKVSWQSSL